MLVNIDRECSNCIRLKFRYVVASSEDAFLNMPALFCHLVTFSGFLGCPLVSEFWNSLSIYGPENHNLLWEAVPAMPSRICVSLSWSLRTPIISQCCAYFSINVYFSQVEQRVHLPMDRKAVRNLGRIRCHISGPDYSAHDLVAY